jgi:WhiB family redox-sensing transcriptional regulator
MSDWTVDALCAQTDPELFFPAKGENPNPGKSICATCPVIEPCRAYAIADPSLTGTWGGLTRRDRQYARRALVNTERQAS